MWNKRKKIYEYITFLNSDSKSTKILIFHFHFSERLQHERQGALESMGISVQASGIKVEKNKYYLVNLNADPSLNELLVYYLKDCTLIGSSDKNDIQLSGMYNFIRWQTFALSSTVFSKCPCFFTSKPTTTIRPS